MSQLKTANDTDVKSAENEAKKSCDKCSYRTTSGQALKKHMRRHETPHRCAQCDHETLTIGCLKRHIESEHHEVELHADYILCVQKVVTRFILLAYYINWVTTSWTYYSFGSVFEKARIRFQIIKFFPGVVASIHA